MLPSVLAVSLVGGVVALISCGSDDKKDVIVDALPAPLPGDGMVAIDAGTPADTSLTPDAPVPVDAPVVVDAPVPVDAPPPIDAPPDAEIG